MDDISSTKKKISLDRINDWALAARNFLAEKFTHLSAEGIGWLGTMLMHCATMPSLLALIFGISDILPSLDVVFFIWIGLFLFFIKALIKKDTLNIVTNGVGFFMQAVLLGLVVFK